MSTLYIIWPYAIPHSERMPALLRIRRQLLLRSGWRTSVLNPRRRKYPAHCRTLLIGNYKTPIVHSDCGWDQLIVRRIPYEDEHSVRRQFSFFPSPGIFEGDGSDGTSASLDFRDNCIPDYFNPGLAHQAVLKYPACPQGIASVNQEKPCASAVLDKEPLQLPYPHRRQRRQSCP